MREVVLERERYPYDRDPWVGGRTLLRSSGELFRCVGVYPYSL